MRVEKIGDATLYMGDCLEILPTLRAKSVDMVLCDLPYGTTACKWDSVIPFTHLWEEYGRLSKSTAAIALTAAQPFTSALVMSNTDWFRYEWVWDKVQPTGHLNASRQPMRVCESVLVFYREQPTYRPQLGSGAPIRRTPGGRQTDCYGAHQSIGDDSGSTRQPTTLITISAGRSPNAVTVHPTQKPVALMEYMALTYTFEGETILDNCMGSGTTGVAAAQQGRKFVGIEREPKYFDIACRRIEQAYKQRPLFDSEPGRTPQQIAMEGL
jgi:site-specific DNA-methyltransferase (adenine-specific)